MLFCYICQKSFSRQHDFRNHERVLIHIILIMSNYQLRGCFSWLVLVNFPFSYPPISNIDGICYVIAVIVGKLLCMCVSRIYTNSSQLMTWCWNMGNKQGSQAHPPPSYGPQASRGQQVSIQFNFCKCEMMSFNIFTYNCMVMYRVVQDHIVQSCWSNTWSRI